MKLDPQAVRKAEFAASAIGRPPDPTPLDGIPHKATVTAIEKYLEETGLDQLDPVAFAATYKGTGIFGWHFKAEIAAVICNYLAHAGIAAEMMALREQNERLKEHTFEAILRTAGA